MVKFAVITSDFSSINRKSNFPFEIGEIIILEDNDSRLIEIPPRQREPFKWLIDEQVVITNNLIEAIKLSKSILEIHGWRFKK